MEPNQNVAPAPTPNKTLKPEALAKAEAPAKPETPAPSPEPNMMATGIPKKSNKGMIFGMVFLALLAACGIGFGVWAMLDANTQKDQLNSQITTLKSQNSELREQLSGLEENEEETIVEEDTSEPVSLWPATMGVIGNRFYVINSSDEIITKDDSVDLSRTEACDIPVGPQVIKEITCGVIYEGVKEGMYLYNGETGTLKFYAADEWRNYVDSQR